MKFMVVTSLQTVPQIKGDELAVSVTGTIAEFGGADLFKPREQRSDGKIPSQIIYNLELSDSTHVLCNPKVRTLDGNPARITQTGTSGSYDIQLMPGIDAVGKLQTRLTVTVDSEEVLSMVAMDTPLSGALMFRVTREDYGLTTRVIGVQGQKKPSLKRGELLITLRASVLKQ